MNMPRPRLSLLTQEEIEIIHNSSLRLLEEVGVAIENQKALEIFKEEGVYIRNGRVYIPHDLVMRCLKSVPREFKLYSRDGDYIVVRRNSLIFNPGSAATKILRFGEKEPTPPSMKDLKDFAILVDALENIRAQSTALIPADVPLRIRDRIRLYPILKYSNKPIITGAFTKEGVHDMKLMMDIVCGDAGKRPIAIFDVCPSPPLRWSDLTMQNLIDCARYGIPIEIISMPQLGATAPVTIAGALVQHNAEVLTGIVVSQLVRKGTPVIYGGSPCLFDMRYGTACVSTVETFLLALAYVEIGEYYGLPTHAYLGLTDSKFIDYQAGAESFVGALLAVLKGLSIISGPGMLEFESVQSMEKLVLDNDICGMAIRFARGFEINEETIALNIFGEAIKHRHFLGLKHTLKWFKIEEYMPKIIDRTSRGAWLREGGKSILSKAHMEVKRILSEYEPPRLSSDKEKELNSFVEKLLRKHGSWLRPEWM